MSDIHVLGGGSSQLYKVLFHVQTSVGNNQADMAIKDAHKSDKAPVSIMTKGPGQGQITNAEAAQIENGEVLETSAFVRLEPELSNSDVQVRLRELYMIHTNEMITKTVNRLRWFGHTETKS